MTRDEEHHLRTKREILVKRLRELELQKASLGEHTYPHINIEIDRLIDFITI